MSEIPSGQSRARRGVRYVSSALRNMGRNRIFAGASTVSDSSTSSEDLSSTASSSYESSSSIGTPSSNEASFGSSFSNASSSSSEANLDRRLLDADEGGVIVIPPMQEPIMNFENTYDQVLSDIVTRRAGIQEQGIADRIGEYLGNSPHLFEDVLIEQQRRQVNLNREMGR